MKLFQIALICSALMTATAQPHSGKPTANRAINPRARAFLITTVENAVARYSKTESPYRKWKDGSVSYLGKVLYERLGILPRNPKEEAVVFAGGYVVADVTSEGSRIILYNEITADLSGEDIFVGGLHRGKPGESFRISVLFTRSDGDYTYVTITGKKRTIPRHDKGVGITKEQYLAAVGK
jgi:hypothetical protein